MGFAFSKQQISLVSLQHTTGMVQNDIIHCNLFYSLVRILDKQNQVKLEIFVTQYLSTVVNRWIKIGFIIFDCCSSNYVINFKPDLIASFRG